MINDVHVHFFSPTFFDTLGAQKGLPADPSTSSGSPRAQSRGEGRAMHVVGALGWDDPVSAEALADRWVMELDRHSVGRAAIIASVPGDEASVANAIARHPSRFVGFFMVDPTREHAIEGLTRSFEAGLRGVCLFPAMHRFAIHDARAIAVFERAAAQQGVAVFVHCGVLSVGVRKKLGLPSPFDMRLGNPLDIHGVAVRFPSLPILVPHFGAGLFREALMLADSCPNVHLDTSSSNAWVRYIPGLSLDSVFRAAIDLAGPRRLLFGTDSSFFPRGWNREIYDQQLAALQSAGVSEDEQQHIFSGNFDRLFPLLRRD